MMTTPPTWDVHVASIVPIANPDVPPGGEIRQRTWSPISATLISGEHDAVLVDTAMTTNQNHALADWIIASGKNLTTIYITHGHGDHHFGLGILLDRFPIARAVATAPVVEAMRRAVTPKAVAGFWHALLPGQIPDRLVVAEALGEPVIHLEGRELIAVPLGHTDTDDTTCLHVPSIGLVVAGDAVYNDVHLYLGESDPSTRREWIAALDAIEALNPQAVIAGHKRDGRADDPGIIEETRRYIRDFDQAAEATTTPLELFEWMLALHPDRVNAGALWSSARTVKT